MKTFRPTKPYKLQESDLDNLSYPVIIQPKIDGFRCVIYEGKALSYSLKPIRNHFTRTKLESFFKDKPYLIDGELTLVAGNFQSIQSAFNSYGGEPDFRYTVFDAVTQVTYLCLEYYKRVVPNVELIDRRLKWIDHTMAYNKSMVLAAEDYYLKLGYEGIIIRSPNAPYKFGRSTLREGYLLALKRFTDAEAEVIGAYPLERNCNEAGTNAHGLMERSSAQGNKYVDNLLGGLTVRGINGTFKDVVFNIGSGFTEKQRENLWYRYGNEMLALVDRHIDTMIQGSIIKYKYQAVGSKDKPRQPIFLGFRSKDDL
jgi:DNA ligase-1